MPGRSRMEAAALAGLLKARLETGGQSVEAIKTIASDLGVMEDRYLARPAAEVLIASRQQGWDEIARYLCHRTVGDSDAVGGILRGAFRDAMLEEGIPADAERLARRFYERATPAGEDLDDAVLELLARLTEEIGQSEDEASETTLMVPTVWEGWDAYLALSRIYAEATASRDLEILFDFSECRFISPVGVAFLGALARHLQQSGKSVGFLWSTFSRPRVLRNLKQNGFAHEFGLGDKPWKGNSVRFRQDLELNSRSIIDYLTDQWLQPDWIDLSPALRNEIAGTVYEIYLNVFHHSASPLGAFTCGQHYPNKSTLSLTVADLGVGIPRNVRDHLHIPKLGADLALEWAFTRGNSTQSGRLSRGLGLDLLKSFIRTNKGSLEIYSGDGLAHLGTGFDAAEGGEPTFMPIEGAVIPGTIITVTLNCDSTRYVLEEEVAESSEYF